jgi:hypothetical protein
MLAIGAALAWRILSRGTMSAGGTRPVAGKGG